MFLLTVWIFHLTFSSFFMTDAVVSNSSFTALRLSSDIPCYSGLELKIAGWKLSIYSLYFIPFHGLFLLHVCAVDISNALTQILGGLHVPCLHQMMSHELFIDGGDSGAPMQSKTYWLSAHVVRQLPVLTCTLPFWDTREGQNILSEDIKLEKHFFFLNWVSSQNM